MLHPLQGPQPHRGAARITFDLGFVRALSPARQRPESRLVAGQFHRESFRRAGGDRLGERAFDDPVLQRLVGQHDDAPADGERAQRRGTAPRSEVSSSLTAIRSAWNVRFAGWPPVRRAGAGIAWYSSATSSAVEVNGVRARWRTIWAAIRRANRSSPYRCRMSANAAAS